MNTTLSLYVDVDGKTLVQSDTNSAVYELPVLFQGDTVQLEVTLLKRGSGYGSAFTTSTTPIFSKVSVAGLSLRVGIGTPAAATGSGTPPIYQNSFTADAANNKFTGELEIGASAVATLLGSATQGTFTFEIEVGESGKYTTVYQGSVVLKAELIEGSASNPPVPSESYLTAAECTATFVKRQGAAGETIQLTSPDGTQKILLYCGDDGTLHVDKIT